MPKATQDRTYIWELPGWPSFVWNGEALAGPLDRTRRSQSELLGVVKAISGLSAGEAAVDAMAWEVVSNSAIEGVSLDLESVRASMLLRLGVESGLAQVTGRTRRVDPVVGILAEAAEGWEAPLTLERIFRWHRALFPHGVPDGFETLPAGTFRGGRPMVVASRPKGTDLNAPDLIHFEAPGRDVLEAGMETFLAWFNAPPPWLNGLLRAGLAHLWFITLHPMSDGNGRLARTITDLALSQDERLPRRYYSVSVQILRDKAGYYDALERVQRGGLDVTAWLTWFLAQVEAAATAGLREVGRVLGRSAFWAEARRYRLEERLERALHAILSPINPQAEVSNRKYRAITGVSRATAQRDLAVLSGMGLLVPYGEARAASYRVDLERWMPEGFRGHDPG